jgi:transcriptional antiterminator NusG
MSKHETNHSNLTGWCILRTAGQRTLLLATSLQEAGFDVWTPQETQAKRAPRGSKAKIERVVPMMPSFVFARATALADLVGILALPSSPHPAFSIFRYNGCIPLVSDREVERLRTAERRIVPKAKQKIFGIGTRVHIPEGAFAGLSGIVEEGGGKSTIVCFGGNVSFSIATFLLQPDVVSAEAA